jgi:hypothetical protein
MQSSRPLDDVVGSGVFVRVSQWINAPIFYRPVCNVSRQIVCMAVEEMLSLPQQILCDSPITFWDFLNSTCLARSKEATKKKGQRPQF